LHETNRKQQSTAELVSENNSYVENSVRLNPINLPGINNK